MTDEKLTEEVRREAVEEAKEQILAQLRELLATFSHTSAIYKYEKLTSSEQKNLARELTKPGHAIVGSVSTIYVPRPPRQAVSRLEWLLALSPGERNFVSQSADAVESDPAALFSGLHVFADWLEDHNRGLEAGVIRLLSFEDGDVVVFWVDPERFCTETTYKAAIHTSYDALVKVAETIGRRIFPTIAAKGTVIETLPEEEMLRLGWVHRSQYEAALDPLHACLAGTPEGEEITGWSFLGHQTLALVDRLKQENTELRNELYCRLEE